MIYTFLRDPTTRRILEQLIEGIRCVEDLDSLIKVLKEDSNPVVVTGGDFEKGELIEIIRMIREKNPGVKIIVVTTSGQEYDRENILKNGASEVFTKPYSPKLLVEAIRG